MKERGCRRADSNVAAALGGAIAKSFSTAA
jgi:hypothetical protein